MKYNPLSNKTEFSLQNDYLRYTWAAYNIFILLSALLGDGIILIASIKYRALKLHKFIVATIQHIAVCDLFVAVISVFPRVLSLIADGWIFGDDLIYVAAYGIYYFNAVGLLLISVMTCGKLFLLKFPFRARLLTSLTGQLVCTAMWILGSTMIVAVFIVEKGDVLFDYRTYDCRIGFSAKIWKWLKPVLVGVVALIPNFLVIVTTLYLLAIARSIAQRGGDNLRWQGIVSTILVAIVYCLSILPYIIYTFVGYSGVGFANDPHSFFRTHYNRLVKSFIFINTISNFYIYTMTVTSFRQFLWSSRLNIFKTCSSQDENKPLISRASRTTISVSFFSS